MAEEQKRREASKAVRQLTATEKEILKTIVERRLPAMLPRVEYIGSGHVLSVEDRTKLRDMIGDELFERGITGGTVNEFGMQLEHILDKLNPAHDGTKWAEGS